MEQAAAKAEALFARAIEISPGATRDQFLAKHCAGDNALRREVESLLCAHDEAGGFLRSRQQTSEHPPESAAAALQQSTLVLNAAAHADVFLRQNSAAIGPSLENFLAALPASIRQEVRERAAAGLRVRQLRTASRPSASSVPPIDDELPRVPGFRLERKLGQGSLGTVYLAQDEKLGRRVALKILRHHADPQVRRRVLDEARKAAGLNDPATVTVFSVLDEAEPPAIVMEYIEGYPLDRFAAQLNYQQKAHLLREVAQGLAAAHRHGLIHRDLKPDNVLVGPDLRPRILDFGLALSLEEASAQGRGFEGTPLYASPEQVQSKPLTAASDIFSFGSLMFKVLTGRLPFGGESLEEVLTAIATTAPPFLREVAVGVPEDLQAVCLACLAWDPADRPAAEEVALELGRFLVGEPVRLKPKLYDDLLRQSISEYSRQARAWVSQSIISREECDALETLHRRLLAEEDHWIIDARRITLLQTILSGATWLAVVATVLTVWMLRQELGPLWRWALPTGFTAILFASGFAAKRAGEKLAEATFLAGAALASAPSVLCWLAEAHLLASPQHGVSQLFPDFTNQQVLVSALTALATSGFCWWRLKMTGFAYTSAALIAASYAGLLLLFNWLDQTPEIMALWCLPLAGLEFVAFFLERKGRVRWTLPFHVIALAALVGCLDLVALKGPTLEMLGLQPGHWAYLDEDRLQAFSIVLNGLCFLVLMLLTERSGSLELRRTSKLLEVLAILHTLSALGANALHHRSHPYVRADVWLYLAAAALFMALAPFRSRWRLLVGGLAGCGLGSYLLVDLGLVARRPFVVGLGLTGLLIALSTFGYMCARAKAR